MPGAEDNSKAVELSLALSCFTFGTAIVGESRLVGEFGRPDNMF